MRFASFASAIVMSLSIAGPLSAASLQVSPVGIEVMAPGAGSIIKLHNDGTTPINSQIRVFRWQQIDGQERLEPTDEVVASPPMARLAPGVDYTVRIVRLAKQPISTEESYRLLVDELPDQKVVSDRVVHLVLRYSIPVFFTPANAAPAKLLWSVDEQRNRVRVSVLNEGDRHVRLAALNMRDRNGTSLTFGSGLTGYVLGRSKMQWTALERGRPLAIDNLLQIAAVGDTGAIHASPVAPPRH